MKLFVDDLRPAPPGWHLATTVTQAIRLLASGCVEEVSLDHDIGCRIWYGQEHSSDETFEGVAHYLKAINFKGVIRIHTANISAGYRMADILGITYHCKMYAEEDYG